MQPADLAAGFKDRWQKLNQTQKIAFVLLAAATLACLAWLGQLALKPSYAVLFSGLEPREAGAIVEKLKTMKIPYQLADEGRTVKVPKDKVYEARIQLASSGALAGGGMGFELFDQNKFGKTDFDQQVDYQRALQEELRRTIVQLEGVEQARVHLVLPQKSVFVGGSQSPPSASVALKLKPGTRLKPEQVQGVCDLLLGSVEGLKPENVHIIDTEGNVLSEGLKAFGGAAGAGVKLSLEQQKAQREYERELESRIKNMLAGILGPNQAVAMVTAELDFSQRQITTSTAANPDNVKVSEHTVTETGTGTGALGVPGTAGGNVTYPLEAGGGQSSYSRQENTVNYQVSTRQETVVQAPGTVKRLSAAVVVNEASGPVDVQRVREAVAAAIGFDPARGDQISVSGMAFDDSYQRKIQEEMAKAEERAKKKETYQSYALLGGAVLGALLLLALLLLARRRRAAERVEEEAVPGPAAYVPVRAVEAGAEIPPEEDRQKKVKDLARERPSDVAEIIKVWIKE